MRGRRRGRPAGARPPDRRGRARPGLEFYVGIPGTVGGAVRMNAGGHGRETREVLRSARIVDLLGDGLGVDRTVDELALGYRTSALGPTRRGRRRQLRGRAPTHPTACEERIAEIVRWRREHQPGGANAGSVFRNPPEESAGSLIERSGLKDLRVGGAVVSPKHANFIQAEPGATAADVRALVREVQRRVLEETGVSLQPELHFVGFDRRAGGRCGVNDPKPPQPPPSLRSRPHAAGHGAVRPHRRSRPAGGDRPRSEHSLARPARQAAPPGPPPRRRRDPSRPTPAGDPRRRRRRGHRGGPRRGASAGSRRTPRSTPAERRAPRRRRVEPATDDAGRARPGRSRTTRRA